MDQDTTSDLASLTVVCPSCHADVGQPCPRRPTPHLSRIKRAAMSSTALWRPGNATRVFTSGLDGVTIVQVMPHSVRVPYPSRPTDRADELAMMPYREYLRTPEWKERRLAALERAHYRCQVCNGTLQLQAHHRTYERRGRERPEDLTILCAACHTLFSLHGKLARAPG